MAGHGHVLGHVTDVPVEGLTTRAFDVGSAGKAPRCLHPISQTPSKTSSGLSGRSQHAPQPGVQS